MDQIVPKATDIQVRLATPEDASAITDIYNDAILNTTAVYSYEPVSSDNRLKWMRTKATDGHPVFVAETHGQVIGFSAYGHFRAWPAYLHTVEQSVFVHADWRGRGIGGALIAPLLTHAQARGIHVVIAGVDADNAASLRLHERLGFQRVAHFKQVGWKFGRWLDLIFLQLTVGDP